MKVFLAGKVDETYGRWRDMLMPHEVSSLEGRRYPAWTLRAPAWERESEDVGILPWPTKPGAVLGGHDYVGPYRQVYVPDVIEGKSSGYFHGITTVGHHGAILEDNRVRDIGRYCRRALDQADMVFACLNTRNAYGTIADLAYAFARGTFVYLHLDVPLDLDEEDCYFHAYDYLCTFAHVSDYGKELEVACSKTSDVRESFQRACAAYAARKPWPTARSIAQLMWARHELERLDAGERVDKPRELLVALAGTNPTGLPDRAGQSVPSGTIPGPKPSVPVVWAAVLPDLRPPKFRAWLRGQRYRPTDGPVREFARWVIENDGRLTNAGRAAWLEVHGPHGSTYEGDDACEQAWDEYEAFRVAWRPGVDTWVERFGPYPADQVLPPTAPPMAPPGASRAEILHAAVLRAEALHQRALHVEAEHAAVLQGYVPLPPEPVEETFGEIDTPAVEAPVAPEVKSRSKSTTKSTPPSKGKAKVKGKTMTPTKKAHDS